MTIKMFSLSLTGVQDGMVVFESVLNTIKVISIGFAAFNKEHFMSLDTIFKVPFTAWKPAHVVGTSCYINE